MTVVRSVLDATATPDCLDRLHETLEGMWSVDPSVCTPERAAFTSALAELVANVVEHGRRPDGGVPRLRLELAIASSELRATLTDDGRPVPDGAGIAPGGLLAESGRGIPLARASSDALHYERTGEHNRWLVVVQRTGAEHPEGRGAGSRS